MKKNYTQQLQKIPPPTGGAFDLGLEKNSKLFLQITMGEMKKAPQKKVFVKGTIFTPKIAQKCKKMANRKFTPPVGGGQKMYLFWESPQPGGITENSPPHWGGDLPPPI